MTEPTATTPDPIDSLPTEPLQLADQPPVEIPTVPATATPGRGTSKVLLGALAGAVAATLIVASGIAGFALGRTTSDGDDHAFSSGRTSLEAGPDGDDWTGGPGQGQGRGQGQGQGNMPVAPQQ